MEITDIRPPFITPLKQNWNDEIAYAWVGVLGVDYVPEYFIDGYRWYEFTVKPWRG
jgi:hypothetical protein